VADGTEIRHVHLCLVHPSGDRVKVFVVVYE
jgi:hypothetical protein